MGDLKGNTVQYIYPPQAAYKGVGQEGKAVYMDTWEEYVDHFKARVLVRRVGRKSNRGNIH